MQNPKFLLMTLFEFLFSGDYARTILNYLPPGVLDPLRTSIYTIDYFDPTHGLGHEFYSLVQKSGDRKSVV